jgi:hypothetical protein
MTATSIGDLDGTVHDSRATACAVALHDATARAAVLPAAP